MMNDDQCSSGSYVSSVSSVRGRSGRSIHSVRARGWRVKVTSLSSWRRYLQPPPRVFQCSTLYTHRVGYYHLPPFPSFPHLVLSARCLALTGLLMRPPPCCLPIDIASCRCVHTTRADDRHMHAHMHVFAFCAVRQSQFYKQAACAGAPGGWGLVP